MDKDFRAGFASYTFSNLFANVTSFAKDEICKILDVNTELRNLDRMVLNIQEMMDIVEYGRVAFPVNMPKKSCIAWIEEANRIMYNINDLLEEISLQLGLKEGDKLEGERLIKNGLLTKPHQINKFVKELRDLLKEMKTVLFVDLIQQHSKLVVRKQHYKFLGSTDHSPMIGRADQMREVAKILISKDVPICITGIGGIGKSIFAKCLCNDTDVTLKFLSIFVSITAELDLVRILRLAIESISETSCDLTDMGALKSTLKKLVKEKTLLMVLDDYDPKDSEDFNTLYATFKFVSEQGRVIFTTYNSKVAYVAGAEIFRLPILSDELCLNIMKQRPFSENQIHKFEELGIELSKKCRGLPLVAKTVGDILHCLPDQEWDLILKCNLWELPEIKNYIVPIVLHNYCSLPPHLKKCFSYFSLFPPGFEYEMDKTVLFWMGEGLIHPISGRRNKDVGRDYFGEFIHRSFFTPSNEGPHEFNGFYKMHDLIHHVAMLVSSSVCQRIEDIKSDYSPDSIRHLSICHGDAQSMDIQNLPKCDKLWTFLWLCGSNVPVGQNVSKLFEKFKILRVLDLESSGIIQVPESVSNFRSLRYLNLSGNGIRVLPESICKLSCLQVFILKNCTLLDCLPKRLSELTNLRHFYFDLRNQISQMPINFRLLVNLQSLDAFIVGTGEGYTIEELKDLTFLTGSICITGLENISSQEQAEAALLNEKQDIQKLTLGWRSSQNIANRQDEVLVGLKPNRNLNELVISNYHGSSFPPWLSDRQTCKLKVLHLQRCPHCTALPPLGKLQFLEHLVIEWMPLLIKVLNVIPPDDYPSLKSLTVVNMPQLVDWGCFGVRLPKLCDLKFSDCPKLTGLPLFAMFNSLQNVEISGCEILDFLPFMPGSMKSLVILDCPSLEMHCQVDGAYWYNLRTVPSVIVDGVQLPTTTQQA